MCTRRENLERLIELVLKTQTNIFHPIQVSYGFRNRACNPNFATCFRTLLYAKLTSKMARVAPLDADPSLIKSLNAFLGYDILQKEDVAEALRLANDSLTSANLPPEIRKDRIVARLIITAEDICNDVVQIENQKYNQRDRRLDRILTSKWTGFPIMFLLLAVILWITITGANYPSQWISNFLFWIEDRFSISWSESERRSGYAKCLYMAFTVSLLGLSPSCFHRWPFSFHCSLFWRI